MSLNIVDYIIKNKKLKQSELAAKLINLDPKNDKFFGVSQVLISKWRREKIPHSRQIELLKIADLYWKIGNRTKPFEPEFEIVSSRWNVLVKTEQNQNDWYDLFSDILSPRKLMDIEGVSYDNYFTSVVRNCLIMLNEAGFIGIPESPNSISNDSFYFDLLYRWMYRITALQKWWHSEIDTMSHLFQDSNEFNGLYASLPRMALANEIILATPTLPNEEINILYLSTHLDETKNLVRTTVESLLEYTVGGFEHIFRERNFEPILGILSEPVSFDNPNSSQKPQLQSQEGQDISHWSEAERKIYEGIKQNEKLLKELLQKLDK